MTYHFLEAFTYPFYSLEEILSQWISGAEKNYDLHFPTTGIQWTTGQPTQAADVGKGGRRLGRILEVGSRRLLLKK